MRKTKAAAQIYGIEQGMTQLSFSAADLNGNAATDDDYGGPRFL